MRLASRVQDLSPSPTLAVTGKAKQMKIDGIDVVSFGAGEPDFDTPLHIKDAALQALNSGFTKYTPSSGVVPLRKAIVEKFQRDNGLTYDISQVVVNCGAKHSLYNIFQVLCDPGDEVLIPSPYWVSYPEMVRVCGAIPVFIAGESCRSFKVTAGQLTAAVTPKTRAVILNSPSNPTGCVYNETELREIAEVAVANDLYVISDEIYEKLIYDEVKHISIASLNADIYNRTFTVNGMSKAYSMTGWRIGYLGGPKEAVQKIIELQDHSTSCPNSLAQIAALAGLNGTDDTVLSMREEFSQRRELMVKMLDEIRGLSPVNPAGAFYVFCGIAKTGLDSMTFAQRLLTEANVAVIPGIAFGADEYIRLSFATSSEQIKKGIERIKQWVHAL